MLYDFRLEFCFAVIITFICTVLDHTYIDILSVHPCVKDPQSAYRFSRSISVAGTQTKAKIGEELPTQFK